MTTGVGSGVGVIVGRGSGVGSAVGAGVAVDAGGACGAGEAGRRVTRTAAEETTQRDPAHTITR